MKHLLVIILCVAGLFSASTASAQTEKFEGRIEYKVSYKPLGAKVTEKQLYEYLGSRMVMEFKKGYYKETHYNPKGKVVSVTYFDPKRKRLYTVYTNQPNKVFEYDPTDTKTLGKLIEMKKVGSTTILDEPVDNYLIKFNEIGKDGKTLTYEIHYFVSQKYVYDKKYFVDWNASYYNKLNEMTNGMRLKFVSSTPSAWTAASTATKITPKKIKMKDLKISLKKYGEIEKI